MFRLNFNLHVTAAARPIDEELVSQVRGADAFSLFLIAFPACGWPAFVMRIYSNPGVMMSRSPAEV